MQRSVLSGFPTAQHKFCWQCVFGAVKWSLSCKLVRYIFVSPVFAANTGGLFGVPPGRILYENLVNNTFEESLERYNYPSDIDEKELHYQRLLKHCKDHLRWWKPEFGDYTAINTNKEKECLVSSWLYEHTIFDLVRIYKTFDWENKCLMFMGW